MATILFTDLVGSTALRVQLGEEQADELRRVHDRLLSERVLAHGGRVVKGGGDGLLTAFESASAALTAAVEMQEAVAAYNSRRDRLAELSVRIGLSAGDVLWEDGDCFGTPVVEAARLEAAASGGQILCSNLVRMMARGRGQHELVSVGDLDLKGLPEPVHAFEVRWARSDPRRRALLLPLPAGLSVTAAGPFVGREPELSELRMLLGQRERAAATAIWLAGEPGIGKTRLAAELAAEQHAEGCTVLFGRCDETLQLPYQPFAEALRHFGAQTTDAELRQILGPSVGPELVALCPDLARRLPGGVEANTSKELDQYRLFEAVRGWLAALAERGTVLFVLDDAHWATAPTLLLLNYLGRNLETGQVGFITTLRDTECPDELRRIIDESALRPGGLRLSLGGLQPHHVAELAQNETNQHELHAQTAGNPLFVHAVLAAGSTGATLDAAIRRRVSRLPAPVQQALHLAALAGLEFDLRVVARAAELTKLELLTRVEHAVRAGLLEESGASRFRFSHGLVRDALDHDVGAARRVLGHRALAEAYESLLPDDLTALARHWSEAAEDDEAQARAVAALRAAGDAAYGLSDHDGAARAYGRALELVGDAQTPLRAQLAFLVGRARLDGGSHVHETEELLLAAGALAGRLGLAELSVEAVALGWLVSAKLGRPSADAQRAVLALTENLPDDGRAAAQVLALRANSLGSIGGLDQAVTAGLEALAMAERVGDEWAIGWAHNAVAKGLPYERSEERAQHALASFTGRTPAQHSSVSVYWLYYLISSLLAIGEGARAAQQLDVVAAEAERRRDPFLVHAALVGRSAMALLHGDLAGAELAAARSESVAPQLFGADVSGVHGVQMFSIRREQGRLAEVAPGLRLLDRLDTSGTWRPGVAALYAELGMVHEAAAAVDAVVVGDIVDLPDDSRRPLSASYLVDAIALTGDVHQAASLYRLMLPWSGLTVTTFIIACYGPVDRYLGMLAFVMGEHKQAAVHLQAALEQCRAVGTPTYEAHTRYWRARLAGVGGEPEVMAREVQAGLLLARQVGMAGLIARLEALVPDGMKPDGMKPDGMEPDGMKPDGMKPDGMV